MLKHGVWRTPPSRVLLFLWATRTSSTYLGSLRWSLKDADKPVCVSHTLRDLVKCPDARVILPEVLTPLVSSRSNKSMFLTVTSEYSEALGPWQIFRNHHLEASHRPGAACGLCAGVYSHLSPTASQANERIDYPVLAGEELEPCQESPCASQIPGLRTTPGLTACTCRMRRGGIWTLKGIPVKPPLFSLERRWSVRLA